mmetsp:Transcript_38645/g.106443  ORF Transcript_38645/g.106443 Transcript_38645/m.106443 type:complete len:268 (+) Transcript_38645:249-1052(+)
MQPRRCVVNDRPPMPPLPIAPPRAALVAQQTPAALPTHLPLPTRPFLRELPKLCYLRLTQCQHLRRFRRRLQRLCSQHESLVMRGLRWRAQLPRPRCKQRWKSYPSMLHSAPMPRVLASMVTQTVAGTTTPAQPRVVFCCRRPPRPRRSSTVQASALATTPAVLWSGTLAWGRTPRQVLESTVLHHRRRRHQCAQWEPCLQRTRSWSLRHFERRLPWTPRPPILRRKTLLLATTLCCRRTIARPCSPTRATAKASKWRPGASTLWTT